MIYLTKNIQSLFAEHNPTLLNLLVKIYGIQKTIRIIENTKLTKPTNVINYFNYLIDKSEEMRKMVRQDISNLQIGSSGFLIFSSNNDTDKLLEIILDNYNWEYSFAFHNNIFMIFAESSNYREIASIVDNIEVKLAESNMSGSVLTIDNFNNVQITNLLTRSIPTV